MRKKLAQVKRPLLMLGVALGLGMGAASAYDTCYSCAKTATVNAPPPVAVVRSAPRRTARKARTVVVDDCYTCEPVIYMPTVVYRRVPTVVYTEPVVVERVVSSSICSTCP